MQLTVLPEMLELLVMHARTRGRPPKEMPEPDLTLQAQPIPKMHVLREFWVSWLKKIEQAWWQ